MASLFGKNKLSELAGTIKTEEIQSFVDIVKTWHNDYHNGSLKTDKETSREQSYNQDFFIKILGYQEKPSTLFSFEPKATTEKGQLPDAVISYSDLEKNITTIAAVVELKGTGIDLDRPQRRDGNMSPVQQGFKYKTQYRNCPFVVVSNFWEFRLYRDNLLDYEVWTLDDLVNPANDYLLFKTWYVLLRRENFITQSGVSKTEEFLSDIRIEQEDIGKKFYKVYKEARIELLRDIYKNNSSVPANIDVGIEKVQKIIDRVVFACFAEDKGLLPDNTLQRVLNASDSSAFGGSLWNTLKGFFEAVDLGSEKLDIPDGYNGGLFKRDDDLNNLKISDEPLRTVLSLGSYNFDEDLSVTILGHIFEQSISDLEEIKNKVYEKQDIDSISHGRRKKDGIFYTPDYIVRYIVDNSLGIYLREHEEKLKEEFKLKEDINDANYEKREKQAYEKYQIFLENVKVLDPACGSGAFLVYVFDYLMSENKRVASILGRGLFSQDEYVRSILKNNIYGVDLNAESVEITKLSLWLKSAEKGKKLTTLDNNIKCGNSLIDDFQVAGNKAFNWSEEFYEIIKNGGFDVVVGNPPYVRLQNIKSSSAEDVSFYENNYKSATGRFDLYVLFMEKALSILSEEGKISYILPHKFLNAKFGTGIRDVLSTGKFLEKIISFGSSKVFADASTYTCIITLSKNNDYVTYVETEPHELLASISGIEVSYDNLNNDSWIFSDQTTTNILKRVTSNKVTLKDAFEKVSRGVVTGADAIFILEGKVIGDFFRGYSKELNEIVEIESSIMKSLLMGSSVSKNKIKNSGLYLLYPHHMTEDKKTHPIEEDELKIQYPKAFKYLSNFKEKLVSKKIKYKTNKDYWYSLHNSRELDVFENRKIISPYLARQPNMSIDDNNYYTNDKCTNLIFRNESAEIQNYYFAILNSRLTGYFISKTSSEFSGGYYAFTNVYIEPISFPVFSLENIKEMNKLVCDQILFSKKNEDITQKIISVIKSEFNLESWSNKLNQWWLLDFNTFIDALQIKTSLSQKDEIFDLFEKYKVEYLNLNIHLDNVDVKINKLVYKIYELSPEEIKIVEQ